MPRRSLPKLLLPTALTAWLLMPQSGHGFELSCAKPRVPEEHAMDFCSLVTWRAASMYAHLNDTSVESSQKFSDADQDHIARRQYHDLVIAAQGILSPSCQRALQRYVCASVFPECPSPAEPGMEAMGALGAFQPVCRSVCREAELECGLSLTCGSLPMRDCTAAMEEGFFVLKDDQGPYEPLPYLYAGLLLIWTAITCLWLYQTFMRHRSGGSRLCRLLSCVPIAKVSMMMLSLAFWSTCVRWGYCSFWMGVSLINCQLMYETFSLIGFVLVAKGWCVTRPTFASNEWRNLVILMCSFYLASSSLLLIRRVILSSVVFWLCTGVLYGSAYTYVIFNVHDRLRCIRRQMRRVMLETPQDTERIELMMIKHWMYQTLSTLLTIFCLTELFFCLLPIVHHIDISVMPRYFRVVLATAAELDSRLWLTLVIHEVVEILILFLVGFLFRPRLISAFHYIEMDHAETEARALRPPPLYLIPVPSRLYGDGCDVSVPRGMLSPTDVAYTRAAHTRMGHRPTISEIETLAVLGAHYRQASGGGGATLTRRQHRESVQLSDGGVAAGSGGPPHPHPSGAHAHAHAVAAPIPVMGHAPSGAGDLPGEQASPLLGVSRSLASELAAMSVDPVKPGPTLKVHGNARYHASNFLVVQQPFGSFAVAVPDRPPR